jgi:hypothetical protein
MCGDSGTFHVSTPYGLWEKALAQMELETSDFLHPHTLLLFVLVPHILRLKVQKI